MLCDINHNSYNNPRSTHINKQEGNKFYQLKDIAAYFGVTTGSVRNWVKTGKLNAIFTPGGHRRIPKKDLEEFLKKYSKTINQGIIV